jgi:hypothetical protein
MATPHNLPPNQNPNQAPVPGQEPLPLPNQEWTTATDDHLQLSRTLNAIHDFHNDYNRHFPNGQFHDPTDHTGAHHHLNRLNERRKQIQDSMDDVFARGDASSLLHEIQLQAQNSRREDTVTAQRHREAQAAANSSKREANVTELVYFHRTRRGMDANRANWNATVASCANSKKQRDLERAERRRHGRQGLSDTYESFLRDFEDRQQQALAEANGHIVVVTRELDHWDFEGETPNPTREQALRDRLGELNQIIDDTSKFSRVDSARAAAYAQAVRLRHRLDSRGINEDATQTQGLHDGLKYLPDGGILHRDLGGLITYGDGTVGKMDPRTRQVNRVFADGSQWVDERPTLNIYPGDTPVLDANGNHVHGDTAFKRWERTRRTEDADLAHKALNYEITQADQREQNLVSNLSSAERFVNVDSGKRIAEIQDTARAEGRTETAEEQREIAQINADVNRLLGGELQRMRANLAVHRERANTAKYHKNFLEVDRQRQRPEQPPQARRVGRFGLRRTVQQAPDSLPAAPILGSHGGVSTENLYMNGRRGNWTIWPNGMATLGEINATTGRTVFYDSQGQPL